MILRRALGLLAVAAVACVGSAPAASAAPTGSQKLQNALTVKNIVNHERQLAAIAGRNGNTRASGTPGYDKSVDYVSKKLTKAGYKVTKQTFLFPYFEETAPASFERVSPQPKTYTEDEFSVMQYSGSGTAEGKIVPVDVTVPPTPEPSSNSGCEAADFAGFTAGSIALVQRGTCDFAVKAQNAKAAGASAVVIFNEGQPGRTDGEGGTLGAPIDIPVIFSSYAAGEELVNLAKAGDVNVKITTSTISETRPTYNVIADSPTGRKGRTLVVGAHLDSVVEGPGINDNGSGTSTNLEIALQMAKKKIEPRNRVRFAFWGAEESGLLGSEDYVAKLSDAEKDKIAANLNFDMLGSPNYARLVYDGDGSEDPETGPGPVGSDTIERIFNRHFASKGLATEPTAFDGRSDYGPFIDAGIPAGGLFSGAEELKTAEQVAKFGGTAGLALDPCYHQACDNINNLNKQALDELGDGAAHAVYVLAQRKKSIVVLKKAKTAKAAKARSAKSRASTKRLVRSFDYRGSHLFR